jgi:Xaa-Pro dipeptidase
VDLAAIEALYPDHVAHQRKVYADAMREVGCDAVLIHSGTPLKKVSYDDQYWPVRPTPFFHHWLPLYEAHCFLLVDPVEKPRLWWSESKDFWERPAAPESLAFKQHIEVIDADRPTLPPGKVIHWIGDDTGHADRLGIPKERQNAKVLLDALDRLRTLKTAYEVACLAEANRRAALGHEALRKAFAEGDHAELDLHLLYLRTTRQDDPETPYKNIVAMGRNASILHHISYGKDKSRAESLLVDAGATCLGYCSDITRTWVKSGGAGANSFRELLAGMEKMQQNLVSRIEAGAPYEDLHDESHRQVSAILKEAGIAKASAEEIDAKGISRIFYPHGLGHSLGLQVHDVGCAVIKPKPENPFLRNTSKIADGQVFTIEPGLYFIDTLLAPLKGDERGKLIDWGLVEALAPLGGIRIEDDVLVTGKTTRNFSREVLPVGGGSV